MNRLLAALQDLQRSAPDRVELDIQRASGHFHIDFIGGLFSTSALGSTLLARLLKFFPPAAKCQSNGIKLQARLALHPPIES